MNAMERLGLLYIHSAKKYQILSSQPLKCSLHVYVTMLSKNVYIHLMIAREVLERRKTRFYILQFENKVKLEPVFSSEKKKNPRFN